MKRRILPASVLSLVGLLCLVGCRSSAEEVEDGTPDAVVGGEAISGRSDERYVGPPEIVGDTLLRFTGGAEYAPGFRNISYIGQIPASTKAPFIIIRGVECAFCDAPPTLLMRSPSDEPVTNLRSEPGWYPYPGRIVAAGDTTVRLSEGRVFWGDCLPGEPAVLLYYNTEFVDDEPARREVRATFVRGDSLIESDDSIPWTSMEAVSRKVGSGECHEVARDDRLGDP